jgi:hypothetical protein
MLCHALNSSDTDKITVIVKDSLSVVKYIGSSIFTDCLNSFFPGKVDKATIEEGITELKT